MERGRPQKTTQKIHIEKILHRLITSSSDGKSQLNSQGPSSLWSMEEDTQNPYDELHTTGKEKEAEKEQCLDLLQRNGSDSKKTPITNGTGKQGGQPGNRDRSIRETQQKLNLSEKTLEKSWENLFASKRLAAKGMNLSYIAPIVFIGEKVVKILPEDIADEDAK